MAHVIHKYLLNIGETRIKLPNRCDILTAQLQRGQIAVWILADPEDPKDDEQEFYVIGTGKENENFPNLSYLNTVQDSFGLVWHVFYKTRFFYPNSEIGIIT